SPAPAPAPPPAHASALAPAPAPAPAPAQALTPVKAVYPWAPTATDRLDARFAALPKGFARVPVSDGSFADFLRTLPLTPEGTKVVDWKGRPLYEDGKHW